MTKRVNRVEKLHQPSVFRVEFRRFSWRTLGHTTVVALTLLFLLTATVNVLSSDDWMRHRVDSYRDMYVDGVVALMAVAPSGELNILHGNYYSQGSNRDWTTEEVPMVVHSDSSFCYDDQGSIHFCSIGMNRDGNEAIIGYASDAEGEWKRINREVMDGEFLCARIGIDSEGKPRILAAIRSFDGETRIIGLCPVEDDWNESVLYYLEEGWLLNDLSSIMSGEHKSLYSLSVRSLEYDSGQVAELITFENGSWSISEGPDVGDGLIVFSPQSGASDQQGDLHLVYLQVSGTASIRYATCNDGAWAIETVCDAGYPYWYKATITLDSDGTPHVGYILDDLDGPLSTAYAVRNEGSWHATVVEERAPLWSHGGGRCSIAVDGAGGTHLCAVYPIDRHGNFEISYMTDSASNIVFIDDIEGAAILTTLVAIAVCVPQVVAKYVLTKRGKRKAELDNLGLYDLKMK